MIKKCAWCKRECYASEGWAYRKENYAENSAYYFCRYNHMLAWEREKEALRQQKGKKQNKRCICLDTGEVYPSFSAAARKIGASPESVRNACHKGHLAQGLRFAVLEEPG